MLQGAMAFFASLGFGILFHVEKEKLFLVGLSGALGGIIYLLLYRYVTSEAMALFIASAAVSLLSELLARRYKCPSTIFLICALIPLVPGGGMYYTMLEIVNNHPDLALLTGIETVVNACSIVVGCTLVSSLLHTFHRLKKHENLQ